MEVFRLSATYKKTTITAFMKGFISRVIRSEPFLVFDALYSQVSCAQNLCTM